MMSQGFAPKLSFPFKICERKEKLVQQILLSKEKAFFAKLDFFSTERKQLLLHANLSQYFHSEVYF